VDVAVDHERRVQLGVRLEQIRVAVVGHRRSPQVARRGMHQREIPVLILARELSEPRKPFFAEQLARGGALLVEQRSQERDELRRTLHLLRERLRPPQHLVGVAHHARPAQLAHQVDHLGRLPAAQSEVAALQHAGNAAPLEVGDHRLECDEVAVDVRDDRERAVVIRDW
jgi:hypothetical protein